MPRHTRRRRWLATSVVALLGVLGSVGFTATTASAAGPPLLGAAYSSQVQTSSARLSAQINPNGLTTSAYFEYATKAAFDAGGFTGAKKANANVGSGSSPLTINFPLLTGLSALTEYRYRLTATNSGGAKVGSVQFFITRPPGGGPLLADGRGWELVSPVDKNGGQVDPPGAIAGGGVLQAAAGGGAVTYGSTASFAGGAGASSASQYLATRTGSGWATQNITAPLAANTKEGGVPYQLFSTDLARGLLFNGSHCNGGTGSCGVENPPLPGSDAPPVFQDYYLRNNSNGAYEALLGTEELINTDVGPAYFDLRFVGGSPDLTHVVLSSCAALSASATEVMLGEGCAPAQQNLYQWSAGDLALINGPTPGAALGAQAGAVSADGSRIYFTQDAKLYLKDGAQTKQVDADAGAGGSFQTATPDGAVAFFTKAGHLWRYQSATDAATDLTPSGGVEGVLGASANGDAVYYQDAAGLKQWHNGTTTTVAPNQATPPAEAAQESSYPPASGSARVSADGTKLLFASEASLTGFDNTDLNTGNADAQVYLYDVSGPSLTCVSCNPTNQRPIGAASIPGAVPNGAEVQSTNAYKPRVLSANGKRVFFDSADALALTDTNSSVPDVYQWEAQGEGSCTSPGGCISLISSGRSAGGGRFIDASADGSEAFFITDDSLVGADPGALDLYDARVGGGFPEPPPPIPCEGDACQILPSEPVDPTLTTLLSGRGNPAPHYENLNRFKKKPKKNNKNKKNKNKKTQQGKKQQGKGQKQKRGSGR
jgi:hypothetical protein